MNRLCLVSFCVLLLACSAEPDVGTCASTLECTGGLVCVDGRCVEESRSDAGSSMDADVEANADAGPDLRDAAPRGDVPCVAIESMAEQVIRPADVILIIDSSPSMGDARARIAEVINTSFDAILAASGIDYRVILVADDDVISIGGALAGYTPPRLFPLDIATGSGNDANFSRLLDYYATPFPGTAEAWSTLLRLDAAKVFIHFTDSAEAGLAIEGYDGTFDEELFTRYPEQFGSSVADGKLVYHAVVGLRANSPASEPWLPSDPIQDVACMSPSFLGSPGPGVGYQALAVRTGGLRYPVCEFGGYDVVFSQVARDVIDTVSAGCAFALPDPPPGEALDLDTVAVRFRPSASEPDEIYLRAPSEAECAADRFIIDEPAGTLQLCPEACVRVETAEDPSARVDVAFGCDPTLL